MSFQNVELGFDIILPQIEKEIIGAEICQMDNLLLVGKLE